MLWLTSFWIKCYRKDEEKWKVLQNFMRKFKLFQFYPVYFYAPAIKWTGNIVLPLSVIPDSVSAHYPSHTWRFSNEIWYIGLSREYEGWVQFGSGRLIFVRVMPLGLRKIPLIFSFRSLSPFKNWHFELKFLCRFFTRIRRLSSTLGLVEQFSAELCPLDLVKFH